MNISELQNQLASAKEHLAQVLKKGIDTNKLQESLAAFEAVATAQRALAAAKGEEHAVPYDIGFTPEAAVSEPVLLQTDSAAILTFSAVRPTPEGRREDAGYAIVELDLCSLTKFGYPNDEALSGHPLYEKGLGEYGVYEVYHSSWVRLARDQNRIAFPDTPAYSTERHFIFTFHDSTFECIARGIRASLSDQPYAEIFENITKRVLKASRNH